MDSILRPVMRPVLQPVLRSVFCAASGGTPIWTPASLFAASEQGAWYDPSDLSTMFQDSTGTIPVTAVGQPVGLILDKRLGLIPGTELFAAAAPNHASVTYTGGVATFTAASTSRGIALYSAGTAGKRLKVTLRVVSLSGGSIRFYAGSGSIGISASAPGTYTCIVAFSGSNDASIISIGSSVNAVVDQIDVRELPGNHASQSTAAARPVLSARHNLLLATETLATQAVTLLAAQHTLSFTGTGTVTLSGASTAGPLVGTGANNRVSLTFTPTAGSVTFTVSGSVTSAQLELGAVATRYQRVNTATDYDSVGFLHYLKFDGVDDALVAILPAMGSDCTVAHITPGGSPVILTGQTVSAGNYTVSTNFSRRLVINRALTPAETATVTDWLNEP